MRGAHFQGIEKSCGFFDAKKKFCVRLKSIRISGRRTDCRYGSHNQCTHWLCDPVPGVHAAGYD